MLVLSVGLLGVAAMLIESRRQNDRALARTVALDLVRDLAARIQANPQGRVAYTEAYSELSDSAPDDVCEAGFTCEPARRARHDLASVDLAARTLFGPRESELLVRHEPASGAARPERYTIELRWHDSRELPGLRDAIFLQWFSWAPDAR